MRVFVSNHASIMSIQLTQGAIKRLHEGTPEDTEVWETRPTLQFLSIKKIVAQGTEVRNDRYRIILSDGVHFLPAMLAMQLNELVENGTMTKYTIVTVEKMVCNTVANKLYVSTRICILPFN
jgi:replication factor A1